MLPTFLGLGAARSGSTWIARNLMEHPQVYIPRQKELHFFDSNYDTGLAAYELQFSGWQDKPAVGEITPQYFHNESVAPLISRHLPDIVMFVSLRNPVDRAYSHYWRLRATGGIAENVTFEDALRQPNDILEVGCYAKHLVRFYDHFEREQILVLFYEDLRTDPEQFLSSVLQFIGVDPKINETLANQRINAAASLQGLAKSRRLWLVDRALRRLGLHSVTGKLEKMNRSEIPDMREDTRLRLTGYYLDSNQRLESLVGRDLSQWYAPLPA